MIKKILIFILSLAVFVPTTLVRAEDYTVQNSSVSWENLPETFDEELAEVYFNYVGKQLTTTIVYNSETYTMINNFTAETDMTLFDTSEAYFINLNNIPQIFINHSDRHYLKDILEANDDEKPAFVPHTIWDLATNELVTRDTYVANVYIKSNDAGVIISYVYIDEYIIDHIVSATVSFTLRQKNNWLNSLFLGKYSDWEYREITFSDKDEFKYRNLTSNWENLIPIWNIIAGIRGLTKTYEMPRINALNLNNIEPEYNVTKMELEHYFGQRNDEFDQLKNNDRYKVWAFALSEGKDFQGTKTQFFDDRENPDDSRNFKIIEINYITNGKLYQTVGSDIDLRIYVNDQLLPNDKPDTRIYQVIAILVVILVIFAAIRVDAFKDPKSLGKFFLALVLLAIILYLIYILILSNGIKIIAFLRL